MTPSLATATRDYAQAIEANRWERLTPRDMDRLYAAMGPHIWSWQRARRLTSQSPWRSSPSAGDARERVRAIRQMTEDVETWEKAVAILDAEAVRAAAYGMPPPQPLELPPEVLEVIEMRREAILARAARRGARAAGGGHAPAPEGPPTGQAPGGPPR